MADHQHGRWPHDDATFYDNVRVPVANRVGEENEGWRMITTQLNHERVGLAAWSGLALSLYEDIVAWAATQPTDDGRTLIDQSWVQMDLARCHAELEAMWLLNWRMAVHVADGELTGPSRRRSRSSGPSGASRWRGCFGHRGRGRLPDPGLAGGGAAGAPRGTGRQAQINTFGGGVNEVQREIVATAGLGMTRGRGERRGGVGAVGGSARSEGSVRSGRFEELASYPDHSAELAALVGQDWASRTCRPCRPTRSTSP